LEKNQTIDLVEAPAAIDLRPLSSFISKIETGIPSIAGVYLMQGQYRKDHDFLRMTVLAFVAAEAWLRLISAPSPTGFNR
jgi:hypothetical protein